LTNGRSGLRIPGPSDAPVVTAPKGRNVYVEGRLEYRSYKGRNRNEREAAEIIAGDVQFLDSKMESKTPTAEAVNEVNPDPR
jgi:single-stranded DNA-binding protein